MTAPQKPRIFDLLEEAKRHIQKGIDGGYPINPYECYCSDIVEICESYEILEADNNRLREALETLAHFVPSTDIAFVSDQMKIFAREALGEKK